MGTRASTTAAEASPTDGADVTPISRKGASHEDPLSEVDDILGALAARSRASEARSEDERDDRQAFLDEFRNRCAREVRPAMQAVLDRLRDGGGGGVIEEHPGGEPRVATPRLTLWMSPVGEIVGDPRPDRLPYLQLDADVATRTVKVTEGDMWGTTGMGHSGRGGVWPLAELTGVTVTRELLAVLRRLTN